MDNKAKPFDSSEQLEELFKALSKAQAVMEGAKKDSDNPFFKSKYADLNSCWEALRGPLTDNGLSIVQMPQQSSKSCVVVTMLAHGSGQWITSTIELTPTKSDPQGMGSALTYARRYGLMSITGLAPEDDDGNSASAPQQNRQPQRQSNHQNHAPQETAQDPVPGGGTGIGGEYIIPKGNSAGKTLNGLGFENAKGLVGYFTGNGTKEAKGWCAEVVKNFKIMEQTGDEFGPYVNSQPMDQEAPF